MHIVRMIKFHVGLAPKREVSPITGARHPSRAATRSFVYLFVAYENVVEKVFVLCVRLMDALWAELITLPFGVHARGVMPVPSSYTLVQKPTPGTVPSNTANALAAGAPARVSNMPTSNTVSTARAVGSSQHSAVQNTALPATALTTHAAALDDVDEDGEVVDTVAELFDDGIDRGQPGLAVCEDDGGVGGDKLALVEGTVFQSSLSPTLPTKANEPRAPVWASSVSASAPASASTSASPFISHAAPPTVSSGARGGVHGQADSGAAPTRRAVHLAVRIDEPASAAAVLSPASGGVNFRCSPAEVAALVDFPQILIGITRELERILKDIPKDCTWQLFEMRLLNSAVNVPLVRTTRVPPAAVAGAARR
ncbi:hypothetical protein EON66_00670 [archaeon]|nr:MAG: hypothetical protein EON66_00670 [archaeon]